MLMSEDRSTRDHRFSCIAVALAGFAVMLCLRTAPSARPALAPLTRSPVAPAAAGAAPAVAARLNVPGPQALREESRRQSLSVSRGTASRKAEAVAAGKPVNRETGADVPAFQLRPAGGQTVAATSEPAVTVASWYGPGFNGHLTANGEVFDQEAMTAAHPTLPFGTLVRVTNLNNGKQVVVRINDRGPFVAGRGIDLSHRAAQALGMENSGVAPVALQILSH